jgi:protein-tyrosine phosphatase
VPAHATVRGGSDTLSNIFWIESEPKIPLAVVLCPRGDAQLRDEMERLKQGGIQTVVSLLEKDEAAWLGLKDEGRVATEMGMQFLSHPFPDANVPLDALEFRVFVAGLAGRVKAGEHVGIHCRGSIGRSTITAVCTLVHLGWSAHNALATVEAARGCPVPNTLEQQRWILRYKAMP